MVFSSFPLYLDPLNWQHSPNQEVLQGSAFGENHDVQNQHLISPSPLPQPPDQSQDSRGGGSGGLGGLANRPNSMAEQARLAKILPPEVPLKCPRCESTNTKFCYYNNYNLSQPRHFCKTCKRYWTRGGALRNIPVGGGYRRNKRSSNKTSGNKSNDGSSSSMSNLTAPTSLVGGDKIPLHMKLVNKSGLGPTISSTDGGTRMPSFMTSIQNITNLGMMRNLGLNFGGALNANPYPLVGLGGLTSRTHGSGGGGNGGGDNHHLGFPQLNPSSINPQLQYPNFLGGFEIPSSSNIGAQLYSSSFQNNQGAINNDDHNDDHEHGNNNLPKNTSKDMNSQIVKTEDGGQGLNVHKQYNKASSTNNNNNDVNEASKQFWEGNIVNNTTNGVTSMWTDLSTLNSCSTSPYEKV